MTTPEEGLAAIDARFGAHPAPPRAAREGRDLRRDLHRHAGGRGPHPRRPHDRRADPDDRPALQRRRRSRPIPTTRPTSAASRSPSTSPTARAPTSSPRRCPTTPFPDERGFFDALAISKPSPSALLKLPGFAIRHPRAVAELPKVNKVLSRRASFAARRYYPFHAFRWIAADGSERFVRYTWLPTVDEPDIAKAEAKRRGPDYLFDDLAERLEREPVRMRARGPDRRRRRRRRRPLLGLARRSASGSIVGTLEITAIDRDADDSIVMDPMRARRRDRALGRPGAALPPARLRPLAPAPDRRDVASARR